MLADLLSSTSLKGALVSARVDSLKSRRTLFAHQPDQLVNPASVTKAFTTSAALALLQPDYRFKTEILFDKRPERGVVKGPMYFKGSGDPVLVSERLWMAVQELRQFGLEKVEGPLVLDASAFDDMDDGPGFDQDETPNAYMSPTSGLSLNYNAASVFVRPGEGPQAPARVEVFPDCSYLEVVNKVVTGWGGTQIWINLERSGRSQKINVRGRISSGEDLARVYFRVRNPVWTLGGTFLKLLDSEGIQVKGGLRLGKTPKEAEAYYTLSSSALGEIVRKVNKQSQNFIAETLWKTMGLELYGTPASWWKGQQAVTSFLEEEVGLASGSFVLHNGSGLNDTNRVSASQVVQLYTYMWGREDLRADFVGSLAVAGADGTAINHFTHPLLARTLRLKSGSLNRVRTISGYAFTRGGDVLVFGLLISQFAGDAGEIVRILDAFGSALSRTNAHLEVEEETRVIPLDFEDDRGPISPFGSEDSNLPKNGKDIQLEPMPGAKQSS